MKIRSGFVSNSSSASFIVKFKSDNPKEKVQSDLDSIYCAYPWMKDKDKKYNRLKRSKGTYIITPSTSMFNDWYDVAEWPFVKMLFDLDPAISKYHIIEMKKIEEEYSDCDRVESFDGRTWDYDYDDTDKKELGKRIEEYNGQYLEYLHNIGIELDSNQNLSLVNYKFSK